MRVLWRIDECSVYERTLCLRGWCWSAQAPIERIVLLFSGGDRVRLSSYGRHSPDVAAALHASATHCRFDDRVVLPAAGTSDFTIEFHLADGTVETSTSGQTNARESDPSHRSWFEFINRLQGLSAGTVLEIGSRARSGVVRRQLIPAHLHYVGLDVRAGENVDIVGDAHRLSGILPVASVSAVFALAVFEHLAMPWKVVVEIAKVLRPGGLVFIQAPQTWPVHEEPWDFWRFSPGAWRSLFNECTGFEIVATAQGEPARVVPFWDGHAVDGLPGQPAYLSSTVLARKVVEPKVDWPVPPDAIVSEEYPH